MFEQFDYIEEVFHMVILAVKEEIILSALLMLDGECSGAPLRRKVIELSHKEIVYGTLYCFGRTVSRRVAQAIPGNRAHGDDILQIE